MRNIALFFSIASLPLLVACGGTTTGSTTADGGAGDDTGPPTAVTCGAPLASCGSVCVSTLTDPNNCGACGRSCGVGGSCVDASCVTTRPTGVPDAGLPPNPGGPAPTGTTDVIMAIHTLYMGDADRHGVESQTAWEGYGLNIDGMETTAASTDVCTLYAGAAREAQVDGPNGIDNSFGENIIPILITVAGENYSATLNAAVDDGQSGTTLFALGDVGTGASYFPLAGAAFTAAVPSTMPTWSGTDLWPIDSSSVSGGSVANPLVTFAQSYMTNRVWVSAPSSATQAVPITFFGTTAIAVRHTQVLMTVAADNSTATEGVFSGVINAAEFVDALQMVAGNVSTSLCSSQAFQSIATQIDQASDIMSDGTNAAGEECDGISLGIGFDAIAAQLGAVVTPAPPPNPCSP